MRARTILTTIATAAIVTAQACSGSDEPNDAGSSDALDGGPDATTLDAAAIVADAASSDVSTIDVVDASAATDAPADGAIDAPDDVLDAVAVNDASDASDAADASDASDGDAADAGPPVPELVSPAGCPWALAIVGDHVFWTENAGAGCLPAVRSCTTSKCATLPPALYTGTSGQSLPMGIAAVSAAGPVFYADGQVPSNYLWRLELDGGRSIWSPPRYGGAGAATDGTYVYFGSGSGLTRIAVADAGATEMFAGDMAGSVGNGPQSVALDGLRVYGAADTNHVRTCVRSGNCNDGGAVDLGIDTTDGGDGGVAQPIGGIVSDGVDVFFTSGLPYYQGGTGVERLLRCPVSGCPGGVPTVVYERVTTKSGVNGSHFGVAVDATHVFFGTDVGTIEMCPKTAQNGAGCMTLLGGVQAFGMAIDGPYLYWADWRGGIYRVQRP